MSDIAARLREAFLGTETGEVVPFDELKDAVKDRWQRVADAAAIRVPFTDAQIERMAKAAREVLIGPCDADANWPMWYRAIRAALAAGGLEPCTVPTGHVLRDRLVDAEAKIERQRAELKRLNALVADLRAEVDEDNAAAASVNDLLIKVQNLTAERDAQEIELADLRFYQREFAAVSAERDTLAERASVPMKVRWDVSDERLQTAVELGTFIRLDLDKIAHLRDVFAAHAVIDAPAGVPSVEELMAVGDKAYNACHGPYQEAQISRATAIRDAVLAGVGSEKPTADQVEALARVMQSTWTKARGLNSRWEDYDDAYQDGYLAEAHAAIAHLSKRPEGLPTAEELAKIGADAWNACAGERHLGVRDRARATAIRDAVLAGLATIAPPAARAALEDE